MTEASLCPDTTPIRVLHLIKTLGLGGAETNLLNLARAFPPGKVATHVGYSDGGEIKPRFDEAGIRLFRFAYGRHRVKSLQSVLIILRIARYIRKHRIDVVHTHNFNAHIWGLIAGKLSRVPVVEHVHDFRYTPADELLRRHGLLDQYRFIKYFKGWSARVAVLTHDHARVVTTDGFAAPADVVQIPNGLPLEELVANRTEVGKSLDIAPDRVVVLVAARMEPSKNIDLVLRIAKRVAASSPKVLFIVAGNGTHLDEYRAQCAHEELESHVRFIGFHRDILGLLARADVFLLPSFLELHSIAILEAMQARVPVVVSSGVGCNDEFIDPQVNGFLCDPFSDNPWIDALVRLVDDPALRSVIGNRGYRTCRQQFTVEAAAERFLVVYDSLVDLPRRHAGSKDRSVDQCGQLALPSAKIDDDRQVTVSP